MKKLALKLVAAFEILCGLGGIIMVFGGISGILPFEPVPALWFGIFPLLSLAAGTLLWLNSRYAFRVSLLVLALQIPFIYISGYSLMRLGIAFNLYITAIWNARAGTEATVLGINFLALGMLLALLWAHNAMEENADNIESNNAV